MQDRNDPSSRIIGFRPRPKPDVHCTHHLQESLFQKFQCIKIRELQSIYRKKGSKKTKIPLPKLSRLPPPCFIICVSYLLRFSQNVFHYFPYATSHITYYKPLSYTFIHRDTCLERKRWVLLIVLGSSLMHTRCL